MDPDRRRAETALADYRRALFHAGEALTAADPDDLPHELHTPRAEVIATRTAFERFIP